MTRTSELVEIIRRGWMNRGWEGLPLRQGGEAWDVPEGEGSVLLRRFGKSPSKDVDGWAA